MSSTSLSPAPSESIAYRVTIRNWDLDPFTEAYLSYPDKPVREVTPIGDICDLSNSAEPQVGGQNASALAYPTTVAGPSSAPAQEGDSRRPATSDDEEESRLFSEQALVDGTGRKPRKRPRRRWEVEVGGDREDDSGDFLPEEDMDEQRYRLSPGTGHDDDEGEENNGNLEESQDHNDVDGADDGAESPAWLKEPRILPSTVPGGSPRTLGHDRMSRFLDPTFRSAPTHHVQQPKNLLHQAADGSEIESPSLPSSYHSGDSDEYWMAHRPVLERTEVKLDIKCFLQSLGLVSNLDTGRYRYKVIDRLGEGMHDVLLVCELIEVCRNVLVRLPRARYPA